MTIYYSATTNAFYDAQVYNVNNIPEDKVAVAESTYKNLMAQQCAGRVIVAAADGTPTTIAQTCGSCTSTKYATKTELTNGLAAKANDNAVVHKSGNETIYGVKSFGDIIKATNGTVQVGADTGYSVTFNYNGNITSKQARGTYNIFFPEGSGTLAIDENLVHRTGSEAIAGNKTFLNDIYFKNNNIDLTVTPSSTLYSSFIFKDKNNKTLSYIQYGKQTTGNGVIGLYINDSNQGLHGLQVTSNNLVLPLTNNTYSLGSSSSKWADVYSTNGHITNTYTNRVTTYSIAHPTDDSYFFVSGGTDYDKGASLYLGGISATNFTPGRFVLVARSPSAAVELAGSPNGSLTWGGKSLAIDENLVHRSGNETINGAKTFNNSLTFCENVSKKDNNADRSVTPSSFVGTNFLFLDKNDAIMGYLNHSQRTTGESDVGIYVRDKNDVDYGFRVTTNEELLPGVPNTYNLGSSSYKWADVYSTNDITDKVITYSVTNHNNTSSMTVCGGSSWDTGSTLFLYGNSHSNYSGAFNLTAKNTTNECNLIGFPNGTLTWNNKAIALAPTFVKFNNGWYRKHSDGFIEQFIYIDSTNTFSEMNVNFAIPFTTTNYHVSVIGSRTDSTDPSRTDDLVFTTCVKDKTYVNIYKFDGGENKYSTSMTVYVCGY